MTVEKVDAWKDDAGKLHESEGEAIAANAIIRFEKLRNDAIHVIELASRKATGEMHGGSIDFDKLEHFNHQTLQPLADYIAVLITESKSRTHKYG